MQRVDADRHAKHDTFVDGFTDVDLFPLSHQLFSTESNSETSSKLNDVFIVNLLFCKDITVKKELNGAENHNQEPQSINLQRVSIYFVISPPTPVSWCSKLILICIPVKQQSPQPGGTEEAIGERAQGKRQRRSSESLHVARQNVDIRTGLLERP